MRILILTTIILFFINQSQSQKIPFEISGGKETSTYNEVIDFYKALSEKYEEANLLTYGKSDFGKNIQLFTIDANGGSLHKYKQDNKAVLLINNAIHPGESCGVDASMLFAREILKNGVPENVTICIIPAYNIGGMINRQPVTRANQIGPDKHQGFRGNARNLDLNRDFIKADSKNTLAFYNIYHDWKPHIFMDNHTTNGADYQHVMTLLVSQESKMHPVLKAILSESLEPYLYESMAKDGFPMCPYVMTKSSIPDSGIVGFMDSPRYSTGYTNLFNTIGFVPEAHMLKPYKQRVESTRLLIKSMVKYMDRNAKNLIEAKNQADLQTINQKSFSFEWKLIETFTLINFKGYEAVYNKSKVGTFQVLNYNRQKPWSKKIPFYNNFETQQSVLPPKYYVIPQAYAGIIDRLEKNRINMMQFKADTLIEVTAYRIVDYKTSNRPYEGHYLHYSIKTETEVRKINICAGDMLIPLNQIGNRFIMETLEPKMVDSYFAWNFMDGILMQKEYYSSYVFDKTASEILKRNKALKAQYDLLINTDSAFASNHRSQLNFIYKNSDFHEKNLNLYPIYRIED